MLQHFQSRIRHDFLFLFTCRVLEHIRQQSKGAPLSSELLAGVLTPTIKNPDYPQLLHFLSQVIQNFTLSRDHVTLPELKNLAFLQSVQTSA